MIIKLLKPGEIYIKLGFYYIWKLSFTFTKIYLCYIYTYSIHSYYIVYLIRKFFFKGFFETQITKSDIPVRPLTGINARVRNAQEVDDLEDKIREHERRISQMNSSYETLQKRYLELTEARHVLKETAVYFEEVRSLRYSICNLGSLFNNFPY